MWKINYYMKPHIINETDLNEIFGIFNDVSQCLSVYNNSFGVQRFSMSIQLHMTCLIK